jgi:hypothetical protein
MLKVNLPFNEQKAVSVRIWYDRSIKTWVIQKLDDRGYQVGDAEYAYSRGEALSLKIFYEKEIREAK